MVDLHEIVFRLGGQLSDGGRKALVPGPGHTRRDRSLSLYIGDDGRLIYHSFAGDSIADIRSHLGLEDAPRQTKQDHFSMRLMRRKEVYEENKRKLAFCQDVWTGTVPASGSPVERYLIEGRGLSIRDVPAVLAYHPAAPRSYTSGQTAPAMVALVQNIIGKITGLHVTYLSDDGLSHVGKIMFGPVSGGAIRLFPLGPQMAVAEGIETALSYSEMTGVSCWATMSTSHMERWEVPPEIGSLVVAADNDANGAGLKAAERLCAKLSGFERRIDMSPPVGDWNDVLRGME